MATKLKLRNITLAFAQLDKAVSFQGGDPKFSATVLLDKSDTGAINDIDAAVLAELEKRFPNKSAQILKSIKGTSNRYNISDGDNSEYEGFAGHVAIKCNSKIQPTMVDIAKQPLDPNQPPRSGDICNVVIEIFSYDKPQSGVSARITGVQVVKRGNLSGGSPAKLDDFDDLSEGLTADDLM